MIAIVALVTIVCGCLGGVPPSLQPSHATPDGFDVSVVRDDLDHPTAIRFGSDGRAWVAEQAGVVKVFDSLADDAPLLIADIHERVAGRSNRGLLGLAPDPSDPNVAFLLYTFPAPPGVDEVVWADDASNCPDGTTRGCVSTGILARLLFDADGTPTTTDLVRGWCHHHASHAPNDLAFGPDGALYAAAGEGSVPELDIDDGTWLPPDQRCNEGAFASRAKPDERVAGDWAGTVVRFAATDLAEVADGTRPAEWLAQRATVVAHGLRNPFRMAFRPATPELWIGDPGWETWEEIDLVDDATTAAGLDFGWPCREGREPTEHYSGDLRCADLTADPSLALDPWYVTRAGEPTSDADPCRASPAAISGVAFAPEAWPAPFDGLLFADFVRGCVYGLARGSDGRPGQAALPLWSAAGQVVDLTTGRDGAVYAAQFAEGTIIRLTFR